MLGAANYSRALGGLEKEAPSGPTQSQEHSGSFVFYRGHSLESRVSAAFLGALNLPRDPSAQCICASPNR